MTHRPPTGESQVHCADGVLILRPNGDLEQADRWACLSFGADDLESLRARWVPFQAQIIPWLNSTPESAAAVEVSLAPREGAPLVGELHRLESGGWVLAVRSSTRAAAIRDIEDAGSAQMALQALSAGITHEWRDSLNSLTVNRELLARTLSTAPADPADAATRERCLRTLRHEVSRMDVLIEALLGEIRPPVAHPGSTHLASIVENVQTLVMPAARHLHVTVSAVSAGIDTGVPPRDVRLALLCLTVDALARLSQGGQLDIRVTSDGAMACITLRADPRAHDDGLINQADVPSTSGAATVPVMVLTAHRIAIRHGGTLAHEHDAAGVLYALRLPMTSHAARPYR